VCTHDEEREKIKVYVGDKRERENNSGRFFSLLEETYLGLIFTRKFNTELRNLVGRKFHATLMHF
jgi:hypothetical protein